MVNTNDYTVRWVMNRMTISIPSVSGNFIFDGTEKTAVVSQYDSRYVRVTGTTGTAVGTYTVTAHLLDTANTKWSDSTTEDKTFQWSISAEGVEIPSLVETSFQYTGSTITPEVTNLNSSKVTVTGFTSGTDVDSYTITFVLKDKTNTAWTDGTTADKNVTWTIGKKSITVPTVTNTSLTYNKFEQSPTIGTYNSSDIDVSGNTATNTGNYQIIFALRDRLNTQWSDGTTANKTVNWSISAITVAIPTVTSNLTYNGSVQSPTISAYDSDVIAVSGNTETNAGNYNVTFTLRDKDGYKWNNNTTTDQVAGWSIQKLKFTVPTITSSTLIYDGTSQSPTFSSYDSNYITLDGVTSGTNAGSYDAVFILTDTSNTSWNDNLISNKTVTWTINPIKYAVPTITSQDPTYDGTAHTPTYSSYDTTAISRSGDTTATNAGIYTVYFTLLDTVNTCWNDDSTTEKEVTWAINFITVQIPTVSNLQFTYDGTEKAITITGLDSTKVDVTGNSAVNVGNYQAVFSLKDNVNSVWSDDSSTDITVNWSIQIDASIVTPTVTSDLTYNGSPQSPVITNLDNVNVSVSGNIQTNAGEYTVTFSLTNANNIIWADGTTADKTATWSIERLFLPIPTVTEELIYNGSEQSPTISEYNHTYITASGDFAATNVGVYTIIFALNDKNNTAWADGTTRNKIATTNVVDSGDTGDNGRYDLTTQNNLVISGDGDMDDFDSDDSPWYDNRNNVRDAVIEDGVTSIGENAFAGLINLRSIKIPSSVVTIGNNAFNGCTNLTNVYYGGSQSDWQDITIGSGNTVLTNANIHYAENEWTYTDTNTGLVTTYKLFEDGTLNISGEGAMKPNVFDANGQIWASCKNDVTKVVIEEGITVIGQYAFTGCPNLLSVSIPSTVTDIGFYAFQNCTSLAIVVIPNNVTAIWDQAFKNCTSLSSLTYSSRVTSYGTNTFENCTSLTNIILPEGTRSIAANTFSGCTNLISIVIPYTVSYIGNYAFNNSGLTAIHYTGIEAEWESVEKLDTSSAFVNAIIDYNYGF